MDDGNTNELVEALNYMTSTVQDAVATFGQVGERLTKLEQRTAALALRVDTLQHESNRRPVDLQDYGAMFRGVAQRLGALERAMQAD